MIKIPLSGSFRMKLSMIGCACSILTAGVTFAQPTNNPLADQYGIGNYQTWIDDIAWDNVIDMSTYANGADNFARFENARDELHAQGGGVLYYPAGTYVFNLPDTGYGPGIGPKSRGLMLKSGVVIRGADLTAGADQAVIRPSETITAAGFYNDVTYTLNPSTVFVFPTQTRGVDPISLANHSAGEIPRDWSLIGLTLGNDETTIADVTNIGVVNVKIEGGVIFWGYHTPRATTRVTGKWLDTFKTNWPAGAPLGDTWGGSAADGTHYMDGINGSSGWHTEVSAGSGRLVAGVVLQNAAPVNDMITLDRKHTASSANTPSDFAHYRFTGRITAHGENIFMYNNVIAKPTKNFVHRMIQNVGQRNVLFDYSNHIGFDVNKSNYGGNQDHISVVGENTGYYYRNVNVSNNWVFSRGNKGFEVSGTWATLVNNHNERYYAENIFPAGHIANPEVYLTEPISPTATINAGGISFDGWSWQTSESASDYMSRGYDMGGRNIWVHRSSVINTGSRGNDGEGIMGQRHNNVEAFSWAFTYTVQNRINKGPGTYGEQGWIGIYDMHAAGLLLFKNVGTGTHGILKAEANWILDTTVTPNLGTGSTGTPATTHPASAGGDYQGIHTNPVNPPVSVQALYVPEVDAVMISWVDDSNNELGFRIDRRLNGGAWHPISYRPASNLGITSGTVYTRSNTGFPALNPQAWMDYNSDNTMNVEYRVVALNNNDDDSTGVSVVVSPSAGGPDVVVPLAVGVAVGMSGLDFEFESISGLQYQLQSSDDLVEWVDVGAPVSGTGAEMTMSGAAPGVDGMLFYRLAVSAE